MQKMALHLSLVSAICHLCTTTAPKMGPRRMAAKQKDTETETPVHLQPNGQPKIKHLVVMLMENRATDHFFGCMAGEGVIGLDGINGSHAIPIDPHNASAGEVNVTCGTANYGNTPFLSTRPHHHTTTR